MFRFLCFVLVFLCVSFVPKTLSLNSVPVYIYDVTVQTASSPKFTSHDGNLKLYINSTGHYGRATSEGEFLLTQKAVKIMVNSNYSASINSHTPLANMTAVYLRWTLGSRFNPSCFTKKCVIYYNSVTLSYRFHDRFSYIWTIKSKKFCPQTRPIGIQHKDGAFFYPCY